MSKLLFSKFFPLFWKFVFKPIYTYNSLDYNLYGNDKKGYYVLCKNGVSYKFFLNGDGLDCFTVYVYFKNEFRFKYKTHVYTMTRIIDDNILSFCKADEFELIHQILTHNMSELFGINHRHDKLHIDLLHYMQFKIFGFGHTHYSGVFCNGFSVTLYGIDKENPRKTAIVDDAFFYIDSELYFGHQCFFRHILSDIENSEFDSIVDKHKLAIFNSLEGDSAYKFYRKLYSIEDYLDNRYLDDEKNPCRVGYLFTIRDSMYTTLYKDILYRTRVLHKGMTVDSNIHLRSEFSKTRFVYYSMLDFFKKAKIRYPSLKILNLLTAQGLDVKYAEERGLNETHAQLLDMIEY